MKKRILATVSELNFASLEEIKVVLRQYFGGLQKNSLDNNIKELEDEVGILKVLPEENSESVIGYILGASESVEDFDVKKILVESGFLKRDPSIIFWDGFSARVLKDFLSDVDSLKEDIAGKYEAPKKLEMRYFDLSVKYHQLYGFFSDKYKSEFLAPALSSLAEIKVQLEKLEY